MINMNSSDFDFYILLWLYGSAIMIISVVLFQITGLLIFSLLLIIGVLTSLFPWKKLKGEFDEFILPHLRGMSNEDEC